MHKPLIKSMTGQLQLGLSATKRLGAQAAKLSFNHAEKTSCSFEAGRLKETSDHENLAYTVDALIDGRKAFVSGNRLDVFDVMIEQAVTLAKVGSTAHFDAYPSPGEVAAVKTHSDKTVALSREKMIEACQQMNDAVKSYNPDLYISCWAERKEGESLLVTSGGVIHPNKRTSWSLGAFAQLTRDMDMLKVFYDRQWCDLNAFFAPDAIAGKVIDRLRWGQEIVKPPTGRVRVYFPPEIFLWFLFPIFKGINGRSVAKGETPLSERLNTQVLSPTMTIVDNPHFDYASKARAVDSDGIPTRKQTLFDKGILQRFLYDLDTAGLAGVEPTGNNNCRAYWPMISPGTQTSAELLAGIDDGLYVCGMIGYGQSNIMNGDFSCNLGLGYRIRNGEIVGRVKDTMISGNLYDLLAANVQLSSDLDYTGRCPHAVVEGINVSA